VLSLFLHIRHCDVVNPVKYTILATKIEKYMTSLSDLVAAYHPEVATSFGTKENNRAEAKPRNTKLPNETCCSGENEESDDATTTSVSVDHRSGRKRQREKETQFVASEDQLPEEEEVDYDFEWLHYDDDDDCRRAESSKRTDAFYESYTEVVQALYTSHSVKVSVKQDGQPPKSSHQDSLNAFNNALHPKGLDKHFRKGGVDGTGYSNSLSGRYQPRRKRVRIKPGTGVVTNRHSGLHYRMETQEEINDRVRRQELWDLNRLIRMRWKQRVVTFQEEEDVGNAFAAQAELFLADKLRQEQKLLVEQEIKLKRKQEKEKRRKEFQDAKEWEQLDELEEDDSVREQSQLLAQLSQSNTLVGKLPDNMPSQVGPDLPDPEEMDFWQCGHVKPRLEDIQFNYNPSMKDVVEQTSADISTDAEVDDAECTAVHATFRQLTGIENVNECDRVYFPPHSTLITNSTATLRPGHKLSSTRHFLVMSSRVLCGSPSDISLENRYIRLLCNHARERNGKREDDATLSNFRMGRFVKILADEQGRSMYLYLQNTWSDRYEAARLLGLWDYHQESPIADNILTSIQGSYKAVRSRVKKLFRKSTNIWSYERAIDEDVDMDADTGGNSSVNNEITTSRGVMDGQTQESTAAATLDGKVLAKLSDESRGALITATCLYLHVEGTKPPVPQLPIDPTNVVFGPVDKFANFYHTNVRMDHTVYNSILSSLLARVAKERCDGKASPEKKAREQALKLAVEYAAVNENNLHKRFAKHFVSPDADIPLVEFYRGVFALCNFLINGCAQSGVSFRKLSDRTNKLEVLEEEDEWYRSFESPCNERCLVESGFNKVAESLWEFCQTKIFHNGLLRFPKLRIIHALAMICRILPASAAEVLSRPIDEDICRSPIHIFKNTLEHMEAKNMLLDIGSSLNDAGTTVVRAAELEYIMHDASEFIQDAIVLDPVNVDYHLWYIGCLASCLLLSSGNRISSRANLYPSQKVGPRSFNKGPQHEVRTKLRKYDDVRLEVSTAFKSLLALTHHQASGKAHFAVCTVLEWTQLMGLLVGSSLNDYYDDIKSLHTFHIQQWLLKDTSSFALNYSRKVEGIRGALIHCRYLEINPQDLSAWRNLVQCLGPLGMKDDSDVEGQIKQGSTCCRLCDSRWIDPCRIPEDRSCGLWWGEGREWWEESILFLAPPATDDSTSERRRLVESVLLRLRIESSGRGMTATCLASASGISDSEINNKLPDWLPKAGDILVESDVADDIRSLCHDAQLPKSFEVILAEKRTAQSPWCNLPQVSSASTEVKAYKIFLLTHMFGPYHPSVKEHIYCDFIRNCYQNVWGKYMKEHCDELIILKWFSSMGINLEVVFQDMCTERDIRHAKFRIILEVNSSIAQTNSTGKNIQAKASSTVEKNQRRTRS
jgi:hypothetical protein